MKTDAFFREATLRICGSLEIEKALWDTFTFLRESIPADEAFLHYYDPQINATTVFASAGAIGAKRIQIRVKWPDDWLSIAQTNQLPERVILNSADTHPLAKLILNAMGKGRSSLMTIRLTVDKDWIGGVSLWSEGRNRFTEEHLNLFDSLRKPFAIALLNSRRYQELLEHRETLFDDNRFLENELRRVASNEIIGADYGLKAVMEKVHQVASLDSPVLILGETGVGKEVIANAIYKLSSRRDGPFITINCGAIPETLIEAELFGYEKGAFTGALSKKRGRFERAHGGTIFLDEIGELPPKAQASLLRVLQEKEIERIGGDRNIKVDIRVISASHRNLHSMIEKKEFREDLYFRLHVFPIEIPPLRERKGDIPSLTQYLLGKKAREIGLPKIPPLEYGALERLKAYNWPGNVRELENAVERAIITSKGQPLAFKEFGFSDHIQKEVANADCFSYESLRLDDIIHQHINRVLKISGGIVGGQNGAAHLLGVNKSTLRHRMRKLGIRFGKNS